MAEIFWLIVLVFVFADLSKYGRYSGINETHKTDFGLYDRNILLYNSYNLPNDEISLIPTDKREGK